MELVVRQFRWQEQFHGIPWNFGCANFDDSSSSMEFHGIPWNLECANFADTRSSMEFHFYMYDVYIVFFMYMYIFSNLRRFGNKKIYNTYKKLFKTNFIGEYQGVSAYFRKKLQDYISLRTIAISCQYLGLCDFVFHIWCVSMSYYVWKVNYLAIVSHDYNPCFIRCNYPSMSILFATAL